MTCWICHIKKKVQVLNAVSGLNITTFTDNTTNTSVWRIKLTWCWVLWSTLGRRVEAGWGRTICWAPDLPDWPSSLRLCSWSRQRVDFMTEPSGRPAGCRTAEETENGFTNQPTVNTVYCTYTSHVRINNTTAFV